MVLKLITQLLGLNFSFNMSYLGTVGIATLDILRPFKWLVLHNTCSQRIKMVQEVAKHIRIFLK